MFLGVATGAQNAKIIFNCWLSDNGLSGEIIVTSSPHQRSRCWLCCSYWSRGFVTQIFSQLIFLLKWICGGGYKIETKHSSLRFLQLQCWLTHPSEIRQLFLHIRIIIGFLCSYHDECRTAAFQKNKKGLIDFVQEPANSFDAECGTEQRQSRESSSSNWKKLNLCLSGTVNRLLRCSPWKKWVGTWEGKATGDV